MGETFGRPDRSGCRPEAFLPSGEQPPDRVVVLAATLLSFAVIFVAELGDKSQLMAMTFALRYRWWAVLGGITVATTAVHILSVAIGHYLGAALPTYLLGLIAGVAFVFFGLWTLRGDSLTDDEASKVQRATAPALFVVTSALCSPNSATRRCSRPSRSLPKTTGRRGSARPWGMVAADALAILVGATAGSTFPSGSSSSVRPHCSCLSALTWSWKTSSNRRRVRRLPRAQW